MKQTPVHDNYNVDLLRFIPANLGRIVEVGCSSGALAKAYLRDNPACEYIGIEIDPAYADMARTRCSRVIAGNIEHFSDEDHAALGAVDCWVFGDTLEHLYDPWKLLRTIRRFASEHTQIVACIPNAQHWSLQARLSVGDFTYQDSGLLDRTHIRWFTRQTMIALFSSAGFRITEGLPRIFDEPQREVALPHIGALAKAFGMDPNLAIQDALPLQYVVRSIPSDPPSEITLHTSPRA